MPEGAPTVVCAWCGEVVSDGGRIVSHGVCLDCAAAILRAVGLDLPSSLLPATASAGPVAGYAT